MRARLFLAFLAAACVFAATASSASAAGIGPAIGLGKKSETLRPMAADGCPTAVGSGEAIAAQEQAMRCLLDSARERRGLPPLRLDPILESSSEAKAADVLRCNEFSHTACGRPFSHWIHADGYTSTDCWRVGENLAWGVESSGTVGAIFRAWMRSPAHRANLLGDYESAGLTLRVGPLGGLTGVHLWVQHFGSRCGAA